MKRVILLTIVAATATPLPSRAAEPFPTLTAALERARARPSAVIAARGAVRSAEGLGMGAQLPSVGNPYLEVFADRTAARRAPEATLQSNLWVPLEVSGQRGRRMAENQGLREWRGAELEAVALESVAEMVKRYGTAVVAAERVRFLQTILEISLQESALYEARLQASDVTIRDAKLAAVDVSRNRMVLGQARAELARALAGVARLYGVTEVSVPARDQPPPDALWETALREPRRFVEGDPRLRTLAREAEYMLRQREREAVEGHAPLNIIVSAGEGADGSARVGGGLAWTFPLLRRNQGEQARAAAERARALEVAEALRREGTAALQGLITERTLVHEALDELRVHGAPAAEAAVEAARATERAGKGDLLHVVTARRDLVSVRASGLDLEQREWSLLGDLVSLSGRTP
jgi:cobalt-zinc-cadmium efflux system outer membrane protein